MALYHSARGSVNYTIVGSPTIVDGVASDFSSSNYLKTDTTFSQDVYNAWIQNSETVVKFRINALQAQHIIYIPTGGTYAGFYMRGSQGKISWQIYSTSYRISPDFVFSVNTDYWLKGTISNGVATFSYSTDGTNYTTLGTLDLQGITYPGSYTSYVQFGYGSAELGAVNGSIDLNHTYIIVNGQPWFGICPIEVKKHQIMGPVGYTVVGSPTITNGVVSGFSKNNYLSLGNFPQNVTDLEIQIKFKTGSASDVDVWQGLFSINHYESGHNVYIRYNRNTRKISFSPNFLYSNENFILYSNALEYETWYTYKISKVGNVYTLYKNGVAEATATSNLAIEPNNLETRLGFVRIYTGSTVGGFNSSIDLNHTYIKVNGKLWFWQPQETKYIQRNNQLVWADPRLYLSGPVNYTVVGSPTITDNVLTNITANNYLSIGTYSGDTPTSIEIGSSFTTSDTTVVANSVIGRLTGADTGIFWGNSSSPGKLCFKHRVSYDNGTTWTAVEVKSATLSLNTKYYVKFIISLAEQKLTGYVSTDNTNWTSYVANFNSGAILEGLTAIAIGNIFGHNASPLPIYLDYTYIKINNQLWFYGKNHATQNIAPVPAGYTYDNTTTSAIGYVDMRTQTFYSAPQGATLGRDE